MYNCGLKLKSLLLAFIELWSYLLFCESFHYRCRSTKLFSVAGFICASTFGSPNVLG